MSHLSEEQLDQLIAAERTREQDPLNSWRTIAARAREEGLIRDSHEWRGSSGQPWLQAAAAVLLLVGGIAIGRSTIGLPIATPSQTSITTANPSTAPASNTTTASGPTANASFASVDDASAALDRAVREYQLASQYIAANNLAERTRDSAAIYRARAQAFDQIVNATESALQTAPHDPVINQYYLATMGARAATRQVVSTAGLRGF
ncbi:MAG TPA: hypothetical protein VJS39_02895 [Gemmatimonadaceae bacterium]|nr:hypothetical protein [Gemmatimonadaceae bacterium]